MGLDYFVSGMSVVERDESSSDDAHTSESMYGAPGVEECGCLLCLVEIPASCVEG